MMGSQGTEVNRLAHIIATRLAAREGLTVVSAMHIVNSRLSILVQQAACLCLRAPIRPNRFEDTIVPHVSINPQMDEDTAQEEYDRLWRDGGGTWTGGTWAMGGLESSDTFGLSDTDGSRSLSPSSDDSVAVLFQAAETPYCWRR
jgi:hypothetical protein